MKQALIGFVLLVLCSDGALRASDCTLLRTPNDGIQPQAVVDAQGTLHLIYLAGKDSASDVFYVRRTASDKEFSKPLRVNSQPGSAIAVGTIRGAQFVLGKGGRVHVAWNGSGTALPKSGKNSTPMLYSRLDDTGRTFEPQRNLMQQTYILDGGGTVAADATGNVYVAWHALQAGTTPGEINRKVWLARSTDEGKTFAQEVPATDQPTGACGCCGMRAYVDNSGALHMLYRSATESVNRDMFLLSSLDQGQTFSCQLVNPWKVPGCPMSSEAFAESKGKVVAAWETNGQIFVTDLAAGSAKYSKPRAVSEVAACKHPAIALAPDGRMLVAWAEGTGWKKGGALAWQVFDSKGNPTKEQGRIEGGIPMWSVPAAFVQTDGRFVIVH